MPLQGGRSQHPQHASAETPPGFHHQGDPLRIVFCLPGNSFSGRFLECWSETLGALRNLGIEAVLSRKYSCNIYYVRNMCLGADVRRGPLQKPFDGKLNYDYLMWLDSDILFHPEQILALLQHKAEIVSGLYLMEDGKQFAACKAWDEEHFKEHGYFPFLTPADLPQSQPPAQERESSSPSSGTRNSLLEVAYAGFGFMLIKRDVFESLEYPWFRPVWTKIENMQDFAMEDVSFCLQAREKGFRVLVDPRVIVGHEKTVVF